MIPYRLFLTYGGTSWSAFAFCAEAVPSRTCYHLIRHLCRLREPTSLLCKTSGTATAVRSSNKSRPHSTSRVQPDYLVSLSMANSVRLPLRA